MPTTTLHYIYDPLCGWCYAAAPLIKAAHEIIRIQLHGGGMMAGIHRQVVTPKLREFVTPFDECIAKVSGQRFGDAYRNGLLQDTHVMFDSGPPTAAILAAQALADLGLEMLAQLQIAHYIEGLAIANRDVLIQVAANLGLSPEAFSMTLDEHQGEKVHEHINETKALMAQFGAQGFPTLLLETDGLMQKVDVANYFGRPLAFQAWLLQ